MRSITSKFINRIICQDQKLEATSPINEPKTLSVATGAVLNTIVESDPILYPSVGLDPSDGC